MNMKGKLCSAAELLFFDDTISVKTSDGKMIWEYHLFSKTAYIRCHQPDLPMGAIFFYCNHRIDNNRNFYILSKFFLIYRI